MNAVTADEVGAIIRDQVPRLVHDEVSAQLSTEIRTAVADALGPLVSRVDRLDRTVFGEDEHGLSPGAVRMLLGLQTTVEALTDQLQDASTARHVNRRWIAGLATVAGLGGGAVATVGQAVVAGIGG